jgi:outer membrane protein assembly factor BamB
MYRPAGMLSAFRRSQEEAVVALDAATGRTIWEHKYPGTTSGLNLEYGAGPHSTPLIVGDRLFAVGSRKELFALDKKTGRVVWSHDLPKAFGAPLADRGYAPSPVAFGNTVILPVGGRGHAVMAFNQGTGAVVWRRHDFEESPASPMLITVGGQQQLVVFGGEEVFGLNPVDGAMLWRHPHKTDWGLNISTPVWGPDNVLLISSAYNSGTRALLLEQAGGKTAVKELWFNNRMRVHIGTVIRIGEYAYGSSGDFGPAFITAVHVNTGEIAWRDRSFARSTFLHLAQPGGSGQGRLLLMDEDGTLGLVEVSPKGMKVLSRADVMTKTAWTVPTLDGTKLYVRDRKEISALELGTGS